MIYGYLAASSPGGRVLSATFSILNPRPSALEIHCLIYSATGIDKLVIDIITVESRLLKSFSASILSGGNVLKYLSFLSFYYFSLWVLLSFDFWLFVFLSMDEIIILDEIS